MTIILTTDHLTLAEASEIRNPIGHRRYGSIDTLRRKVKSGALPSEMRDGKYYVSRDDLDAMVEKKTSERAYAGLVAAAKRAAKQAPPISAERRELIASILRSA
ncbi:helix-turn-helix domain-containing protein [Microbacterium halotolerans]|uniref:helix-turn-helix domain-containing protein n=1 Tax=Microbacterium halotolerans TaxID=246613 RepID=UPI000E6AAC25|nr:helix-turn-helix domain-containing protein [Microbacterium halotolerans]